jgi:hypothetical protein
MQSSQLSEILLALQKKQFLLFRLFHKPLFFPRALSSGLLGYLFHKISLRSWKALFEESEFKPLYLPDPDPSDIALLVKIAKAILDFPLPKADWAFPFFEKIQYWATAFLYRIEGVNGGIDPEAASSEWLKREAHLWKKQQKIFWEHDLTLSELQECEEACRYRLFLDLLVKYQARLSSFFTWIIRDRLPADIFIQFPHLVKIIYDAELTGRIGTVGKSRLKIRHLRVDRKILKGVTLPFEGREVNILDLKKKVLLRGGMEKTVEEYFYLFSIKERQFVDVEFFSEGISNWNSQHLGILNENTKKYEVIDLDQPEWWRQLPPIEILSFDEAQARFSEQAKGDFWCVAAKASRQYLTLDYSRCHAYLEVAIPKDDHYLVYAFGKFAREFPYGVVDNMRMFTRTTFATVAYPDENIYHTTRQHVGYNFLLNHYEGLTLMEEIRKDIARARDKNMVFQFESDNCAHWIQTHLEELLGKEKVPNLFRVRLVASEATGPVGLLFRTVNHFPHSIQPFLFQIVHFPFGAWRGHYIIGKDGKKIYKSLTKSDFWKDTIVYLPAFLHRQKERGYLSSNTSEQETEKVKVSRPYSLFLNKILGNQRE